MSGITKTFLASVAVLVTAATPLHAGAPDKNAFQLPSIFESGMVLQRDREIPVLGWASPGDKITAAFAGKVARAVAGPDGRWVAALAAMPPNRKGRTLTVKAASGAKREPDNVVIGEARIAGPDVVRVSAPGVASPKAVRYAWSPAPDVNLVNSEDIPAGPFRSDGEMNTGDSGKAWIGKWPPDRSKIIRREDVALARRGDIVRIPSKLPETK